MRRTKSELELHLEATTACLKAQKEPLTEKEEAALQKLLHRCAPIEHEVKILFPCHRLSLQLSGKTSEDKEQCFMAFVEELCLYISDYNHAPDNTVTYELINWISKIFITNLPEPFLDSLLQKMVKRKYRYK